MTPQQARQRRPALPPHWQATRARPAIHGVSDDIRSWAPLRVGKRLHLADDILRSEAVEFRIVAQLGRSAAPGHGVEPN